MLVLAPPRVWKQNPSILTKYLIWLPISRPQRERERKHLTKHLTFLSPLFYLFPLCLGTESLSEWLYQLPSLTSHPDYYAFINFDSSSTDIQAMSQTHEHLELHDPSKPVAHNSELCLALSWEGGSFCQPCFILPLVQADDRQTPQPCLLNMNESCGDRIAMPSAKLSVFLRQAAGLYGHFVKMHLNQNAHLTFPHLSITSSIKILPVWGFLTTTWLHLSTILLDLHLYPLHYRGYSPYSTSFLRHSSLTVLFSPKMTVLLYYFETGSDIDTRSKLRSSCQPSLLKSPVSLPKSAGRPAPWPFTLLEPGRPILIAPCNSLWH